MKNKLKVIIAVVAIVIVVLAIVGTIVIGTKKSNNNTKEKNNNEVETRKVDELTKEDVIGTYKNIGLLSNENVTYTLNSNTTFEQKAKITSLSFKGTFTVNPEGSFTLSKNKSSISETFYKYKDYFYGTRGISYFSTDQEYGLHLTLNENNRTNQIFRSYFFDTSEDSTGETNYYVLTIQFFEDGTFKLYKFYHKPTSFSTTNNEEFKGTYNIENDIIKLNYKGKNKKRKEDTLLIIGNNIYFDIIKKQ